MGLFSGSKSKSVSNSQSSSFDNVDSSSFGFGQDSSISEGSSSSRSRQSVAFQDIFSKLFGDASGAVAGIDTSGLSDTANLLFSSGSEFLDGLGGGGAGAEFLESRLSGRDGVADAQVEQLGDDLARFLAEDANPAITARGVSAGTLGGSRGEVQRGIATRGAAEAFTRGSTDIRARDQAARDEIAGTLAADESSRFGTGLAQLPGLFGLAESGLLSSLSPFAALSQILGGPTTLTESDSVSSQLAESLGIDISGSSSVGRAGSQSTSKSKSKSGSFSFGLS